MENEKTIDKCDQIMTLMTLSKMTLTEINTLSEDERKLLSKMFLENEKIKEAWMKEDMKRIRYA